MGDVKQKTDKIIEEAANSLKLRNDNIKIKKYSIPLEQNPKSAYTTWVDINPVSLYSVMERMCAVNNILVHFKKSDKTTDVLITLFNIKDSCVYYENIYDLLTKTYAIYITQLILTQTKPFYRPKCGRL